MYCIAKIYLYLRADVRKLKQVLGQGFAMDVPIA